MVTFQIPSGPMNLAPIFPAVDFSEVEEYFIELRDQDTSDIIVTTPHFTRGCCCNDQTMRIFFVNYLGGIDAVNFRRIAEETVVASNTWTKPLKSPLEKWDGGKQRFNVSSNEKITAENNCYGEQDQEYLKQLVAAPNAWVQWIGTQGQDDDYIPIVILDDKYLTRKIEGRYEYILQIQFEYANENIILRN